MSTKKILLDWLVARVIADPRFAVGTASCLGISGFSRAS